MAFRFRWSALACCLLVAAVVASPYRQRGDRAHLRRVANSTGIDYNGVDDDSSSRHHQSSPRRQGDGGGLVVASSSDGREFPDSCPHCGARQFKKDYRLAAIKEDILRKLRLSSVPNITGRRLPEIPPLRDIVGDQEMLGDSPAWDQYLDEGDDDRATTVKMMLFHEPANETNKPDAFRFRLPRELTSPDMIEKVTLGVYIRRAQPHPDRSKDTSYLLLHRLTGLPPSPGAQPNRESITRKPLRLNGDDTGRWHQFNLRNVARHWVADPSSNYGLYFEANDMMGNSLPVITPLSSAEEAYKPYLEIYVKDQTNSRSKRNLELNNCDEHSAEKRCCRYPLTVDFESFGWNFVIVPRRYSAYYCAGECPFIYHQQNPHAHLVQQTLSGGGSAASGRGGSVVPSTSTGGPCCSPRRMSAISMLYYDDHMNIVYGRLPGMVVEQCGCS